MTLGKGFILGGLLTNLFLPSANAYLDPGSGSIIIQAIFAALSAAVIFFGYIKNSIISFVRRLLSFRSKEN
jgi:type IV secretory pathway VirB6-like protein